MAGEKNTAMSSLLRICAPSCEYGCFPTLWQRLGSAEARRTRSRACDILTAETAASKPIALENSSDTEDAEDTDDGLVYYSTTSGSEEDDHVAISFNPAQKLGLTVRVCDGSITGVAAGSQADRKGMKVGWSVSKIGCHHYTHALFRAHATRLAS